MDMRKDSAMYLYGLEQEFTACMLLSLLENIKLLLLWNGEEEKLVSAL